jgi:ParB family chromosome partitioning protein
MTSKRNALGRGLSALLDTSSENPTSLPDPQGLITLAGTVISLPVEQIEPNPFQPRSTLDEGSLKELAESIKQHGVIQPITVRKMSYDRYQLISGERRWRAARLAGLDYLPAYIRVANDESMLEMAIVENIQREDLNPIEIAMGFQRLIEEVHLTVEQLAERVGKDRSTVANFLRLLKLPPLIQAALRDRKITMGHARAIINISDPAEQMKIFHEIMKGKYTVRDVEAVVRSHRKKTSSKMTLPLSPEYRSLSQRLSSHFETPVEIHPKANGSGCITIRYFSVDDLNRILEMLDA